MNNQRKIVIYADCSVPDHHDLTPQSKCGWAYKLIYDDGHEATNTGFVIGKDSYQTGMIAMLESLKAITDKSVSIELHSDSENALMILEGIFTERVNKELWKELKEEKNKFKSFTPIFDRKEDKNEHLVEVHKLASNQAKGVCD